MTYALLLLLSLIGSAGLWLAYKRNIELFACILILINFEVFYLLPKIGKFPIYRYVDIFIVTLFLVIRLFKGELRFGRYGIWVLVFILLLINSILVAYSSGQDFDLGIKAAKFYFLILVYFLFVDTPFDENKFSRYFIVLSMAIAIIAFIQYLSDGHINMFPGLTEELKEALIRERIGRPRINIGSIAVAIASVLSFASFCRDRRNLASLLISMALSIYMLLFNQTRILILAMVVTMVALFFLANKQHPGKIILGIFLLTVVIMFGALFIDALKEQSSLYQLTKTEMGRKEGSYQARIQAYQYYWREILSHPFLGQGILNFNWIKNPEGRLHLQGINLSDIGIVHWVVAAGGLGFAWFIIGLGVLWLDIMRYGTRCLVAAAFIILATIAMPTIDLFVREDHILLFGIFLAILSNGVAASKARKSKAPQEMTSDAAPRLDDRLRNM